MARAPLSNIGRVRVHFRARACKFQHSRLTDTGTGWRWYGCCFKKNKAMDFIVGGVKGVPGGEAGVEL